MTWTAPCTPPRPDCNALTRNIKMATGKAGWYVVWQGRKVGVVRATGRPAYRFHKGPYARKARSLAAARVVLRKLTHPNSRGYVAKRNPGERIAARDVLAERNHNGSWAVSVGKDGEHHRMTYYGYSKRDAVATFLRDLRKGGGRLMGHQLKNPNGHGDGYRYVREYRLRNGTRHWALYEVQQGKAKRTGTAVTVEGYLRYLRFGEAEITRIVANLQRELGETARVALDLTRAQAKRPRRTKRRQGLLRDMRRFGLGRGAGIVGETARVALDLTRAQRKARELGWEYEFIPEEERYEDVYGKPAPAGAEFVTVVLKDRRGNVLASLGFVEYNDDAYLKQVQAELASEALHEPRYQRTEGKTHFENPPLRDFQQVGPNQAELFHGNLRVFYSYNKAVAFVDVRTHRAYRTEQHWSNTTSKHINKWLRSLGKDPKGEVMYLPQEQMEAVVTEGGLDEIPW